MSTPALPVRLSTLLTAVYVTAPMFLFLGIFVALAAGSPLGAALCGVGTLVSGFQVLPLTWVAIDEEHLHVRGIGRELEIPLVRLRGVEESRFGGGLSIMRKLEVSFVDEQGRGGQFAFVESLTFDGRVSEYLARRVAEAHERARAAAAAPPRA